MYSFLRRNCTASSEMSESETPKTYTSTVILESLTGHPEGQRCVPKEGQAGQRCVPKEGQAERYHEKMEMGENLEEEEEGKEETSNLETFSLESTDDDSAIVRQSSSDSNSESHMIPDSEEEFTNVARTLSHYKGRRRRRQKEKGRHQRSSSRSRSVDSNCSCSSCDSNSNLSFFGTQEGPPGGESTFYRRFYIWLESTRYLMAVLLSGLLLFSVMFVGTSIWLYHKEDPKEQAAGKHMMKWTIPLLVVSVLILFLWQAIWYILLWKGYGKGDHLTDRRNMIKLAQKDGFLYTIRGAIYAPVEDSANESTDKKTKEPRNMYGVVAYDSEFDSTSYFDSDLEPDGQYKRDLIPYRGIEDPITRDKRNIYTRKAWFRDVPIIWWDVSCKNPMNF